MDNYEDMRVTVTGGDGSIGFHLCKKLIDFKAKVRIFDNLSSNDGRNIRNLIEKKFDLTQGDIRDFSALEAVTKKCEFIFHLAAQTSVPYSMIKPAEDFEVNALGTLNVLECARKADAKVIFTSTAAVYGNAEKTPTSEDNPANPISFYGLSKHAAEDYCSFYQKTYGLEVVALRIFNAYGLGGHGVIPDFIVKLKRTPHQLEVLGTGKQSRDFIHVSDVVSAIVECARLQKANGKVYNIGSGTKTSVTDLAKTLINLLDLNEITTVCFRGGAAWEGDAILTHADITKIVEELNWRPLVRLRDGLKSLITKKV